MRHARHHWQTVRLLVGALCLWAFSITPLMAAPVTYTFTGVVTGGDSALTPPLPLNTPAPVPRVSRSKNKFITQLIGSTHHTTNSGSLVRVNIGAYQSHLPSGMPEQGSDSSTPNFLKATHLSSAPNSLTLIPSSSVTSWLSHHSFGTLGELSSDLRTAAFPTLSELPPNIGAFSYPRHSRLPSNGETALPNPATIAQGTIAPATADPLPASLIIAGVGLVALIGLGAGGLRHG